MTLRLVQTLVRSVLAVGLAPALLCSPALAGDFLLSQWVQPVPRSSVLAEPGYYVWCGTVVEDAGQFHLFYSRWPTNTYTFNDGWLFGSEICHAVADQPGGPFTPTGVVLGKRANDPGLSFWDSQMVHNPHIQKFDDRFHLYFIGSADPGAGVWPGQTQRNRIQRNQRIGVVSVTNLGDLISGNFVRPDAPILSPVYSTNSVTDRTTNPTDVAANRIVNNPSVARRPDGKYQLLYKSNWPQSPSYGHGFALADDPAGPFTISTSPGIVFSDQGREDENHWYDSVSGKYCLLVKNFAGGGTEQLVSTNGTTWTSRGIQMSTTLRWADGVNEPLEALERPQILRDTNGQPIMLYMAARRALPGGAKEAFNVHIPLRFTPATNQPGGQSNIRASALTNTAAIKNSGVLLSAVNLGALTDKTVNGLTFTASGTNVAALAADHGFLQSGGAAGAILRAATVETVYDGLPEFEDFLDTMVWQTANPTSGAKLQFNLNGLPIGRTCRLQLFLGETRAGFRHGPQTVEVAGQVSAPLDYGPASSLIEPGATALVVEATWVAAQATETVTLNQQVTGGNGLQISAYALHDVSPPALALAVSPVPAGNISITWRVRPGFSYSVSYSENFSDWLPDPLGAFAPGGNDPVDYTFVTPVTTYPHRFFRLVQAD